jgi:tetratricopeptide (TPR) repeat protein
MIDAFDDPAVIRRALQPLSPPATAQEVTQITQQLKIGGTFANSIVRAVRDGGSYRLVRIDQSADAEPAPVFRLLSQNSLNYHTLRLGRDGQGRLRVVDVDVFVSGEALSYTMRRMLMSALSAAGSGRPGADQYEQDMKKVEEMQRIAAGGDLKTAMELWEKLPEGLRRQKPLMLYRIQYTQRLGGEAFEQAIKAFEKQFPDDGVVEMIRIQTHTAARRYDEALAAVDRLDKLIKDPYLDLLRAQFFVSKKDAARAELHFERLLKWDPTFERGWGGLLVLSLGQKNHAKTIELLDRRAKAVGKPLSFEFMESSPDFADFVGSPEYKAWKQRKQLH